MRRKICTSIFTLLLVSCFCTLAQAQIPLRDVIGKPIQARQYLDVQGSPYLYPEWTTGTVTLADGTTFEGLDIMYDQVKDDLLFKTKDNQVKEFVSPVKEFKITYIKDNQPVSKKYRKGYSGEGVAANAFCEVLEEGKATLLSKTTKTIYDTKGYSSATIVRQVQQTQDYYIVVADKLVKIRRDKKTVLGTLGGDVPKLEQYIKANTLNLKEDKDLAKLIAYHNSLN